MPGHFAVWPVIVAVPSGCAGIEELHQHGSKDLRGYLVGLTFQSAVLRMRHGLDQRQYCNVHKGITRTAVHDECRDSDASCFLSGNLGVFPHGSRIVSQGGCHRLPHRPHWMLANAVKVLGGHPHQHHKECERIAFATLCQHVR